MRQFEIYWEDLTTEAQNEILDKIEELGIECNSDCWTFSGAGIIYLDEKEE